MQVLKFGGTSVGSISSIIKVTEIVSKALEKDKTVVVASALGGITDKLIELGKVAASNSMEYEKLLDEIEHRHLKMVEEIIPLEYRGGISDTIKILISELREICNGIYKLRELSFNTLDLVMSFGELLSTKILATKFTSMGIGCKWIDTRNLIKTYYDISQNIVDVKVTYDNVKSYFTNNHGKLFVFPGFIASDKTGRTTTLGRGGSDYTASLLSAAAGARILEIWTDVNGMMTADPRIVPEAKTISNISYKEALELSHFGAKVVYPPTIQPVIKQGIPIAVKNTFYPNDKGTLIELNPPESENNIKGISGSDKLAILSMEGSGMIGIPGYSSRLFDVLTKNEINIILITQASSVHTMLVAIEEKDALKAKKAVDELFAYEISLGKIEPLKVEKGFSIISLVGDNMKNQSGASGRMFEALGKCGINIRAIAQGSSERNVSAVIKTEDSDEALRAIHKEFFSKDCEKIALFIAGFGNVGKELIRIISEMHDAIKENKGLNICICGICNSKKMIFSKSGLDYNNISHLLEGGDTSNIDTFISCMESMKFNKRIFVDCTSNAEIAELYPDILSIGCNVVTCNKIANSSGYPLYKRIREIASERSVNFKYNTNVGAALPILSTLRQMVESGDKVNKIEAMVSGSLNYIFSEYCKDDNGGKTFESIVKEAQELGYTEPDPNIDLSGTDVLRKAVILAREIGYVIEQSDAKIEKLLPDICEKRIKLIKKGEKLRYIAEIKNGKITIGLKSISSEHPFYKLEGTDAAVSISTKLYSSPVVIIGAGAGGRVTAGGVFSDILSI